MLERWSVTARAVSDAASANAVRRRCPYVEPIHLLESLLKESSCAATRWLQEEMRLDAETLAPELDPELHKLTPATPDPKRPTGRLGQLSASMAEVLRAASTWAAGRERGQITTLDLLRALLRQERDPAAEILRKHRVMESLLERAIERGRWRDD